MKNKFKINKLNSLYWPEIPSGALCTFCDIQYHNDLIQVILIKSLDKTEQLYELYDDDSETNFETNFDIDEIISLKGLIFIKNDEFWRKYNKIEKHSSCCDFDTVFMFPDGTMFILYAPHYENITIKEHITNKSVIGLV